MAVDHVARNMAMDAGGGAAPVDSYTKSETDALLEQKADKSEVTESVTAAVAQIVVNAPEDFDTLKEMSDWIASHEDSAAAMNTAILRNAADIDAVETQQTDIQEQIDGITDQIFGLGTQIPSGADLNNYTKAGVYYCKTVNDAATLLNSPYKTHGFRLEVSYTVNMSDRFVQKIIPNISSGGVFYTRTYDTNGFGSWYKFSGTAVTT